MACTLTHSRRLVAAANTDIHMMPVSFQSCQCLLVMGSAGEMGGGRQMIGNIRMLVKSKAQRVTSV